MGRKRILGGFALLALVGIAPSGAAAAEQLTRSSCWTSALDTGARRTMCFVGSGRLKMTNRNRTSDDKGWSSCEWAGLYLHTGSTVTVAFAPGSGKCSNGAASPQWAATCDFAGEALHCQGSSIVDGKLYEADLTFK